MRATRFIRNPRKRQAKARQEIRTTTEAMRQEKVPWSVPPSLAGMLKALPTAESAHPLIAVGHRAHQTNAGDHT